MQQDEQYSKAIIDFFNDAERFISFYDDSLGWKKDFTFKEIEDLAIKYYNVIYRYSIDYYFYFKKLHKQWEEEVINNDYKIINKKPAVKLRIIREKLSEYYPSAFTDLLQVPYLFRIKVIRFDESTYYLKNLNSNIRQTDMVVKIEDIIKGKEYFKINDTLKVSFFGIWFHGATEEQYFKVDSTYFLPVNFFRIENKNTFQYRIHMLPDFNFAIYPIINEIVHTPKDFFGTGEQIKWEEFNIFMKNIYVIQ
ncbi:MAG: hypothetical protein Q8Q47_11430 [Ignavibacteriaceae bacterium]|nr:hypothetical protein [Ignavibacteriaceae bacterium]